MNIRPAKYQDCDDLGLVIVTASLATLLGRVPEETIDYSWTPQVSATNWKRDFADITKSGARFYVAEFDSHVIGYVLARPQSERPDFEWAVTALYVLPSQQRRGVGRALLAHLAREHRLSNVRSLMVGCVKENPSCGFYVHLGGVEVGRRRASVDRYRTEEILYGWQDISILFDAGKHWAAST